jgi:intergrase/recombinase
MTDAEKTVAKGMNRIISELTLMKAAYESVLKRYVEDWQEKVEAAKASEPLQAFARNVEEMRQGIDLLIDENNLIAPPSRYSRDGLVD